MRPSSAVTRTKQSENAIPAGASILDQDRRFDAILCDLMMPLGDGMNFYHRLSAVQSDFQAKVIFMTGGAFTAQARAFLDAVGNRTLEKPARLIAVRSHQML